MGLAEIRGDESRDRELLDWGMGRNRAGGLGNLGTIGSDAERGGHWGLRGCGQPEAAAGRRLPADLKAGGGGGLQDLRKAPRGALSRLR